VVWPDAREDDVSDKPSWIQAQPALSDEVLAGVRANQVTRIQELLGLDDTVAAMFSALDARGVLDGTAVLFASDNGVVMGEHRIPTTSKNLPYEPCVRVPCFVRAPGIRPAVVDVVAHMSVDLTATCVDLGGARADRRLDGVSLLDIAANPSRYAERPLLYERDSRDDAPELHCPPARGVFTPARKLIRYETTPPTYELYDLDADPQELRNVADDAAYADDRASLERTLTDLLE
jgi:arylsulfatase A-like enzyme